MIKENIAKLVENSIRQLAEEKKLGRFKIPKILIEHPKEKIHGDYSTNIALQIGKITEKKAMEVAKIISLELRAQSKKVFDKIEEAEPGFINFFLSKEYLQNQAGEILEVGDKFGSLKISKGQKVNVEFISANPTGPLTLGNGRGGFCGDVLSNVFKKAGFKVTREYYINDIGEQVKKLGHSVIGDSEAVYVGEYIDNLKKKIKGKNPEKVGEKAAEIILKKQIMPAVKRMGIKFDNWFSEKSLYKKGEVDKAIQELSKRGFTYESEKAVWFKCKNLGDDKDRVLIRADGIKTYFASDIAYLKNKIKRGFGKIILFLGADHYGYVARLKAAAEALGFEKKNLFPIVMQLVQLFSGGKEVRMSKRTGIYVTLDELIDEVGLDVARFFFLTKNPNTHLNFDLDLAKEKSEKNPVYYVQYAHARICSILKKAKVQKGKFGLLNHPSELALIKQLVRLPEIIEDTVKDYQVQRMPQYATELATYFHRFYRDCKVLTEDKELAKARLSLISATKTVLKNTLDLMGISAPEKM